MSSHQGINPQQVEYFRRRLLVWRDQLLQEPEEATSSLFQPKIALIKSAANQTNPTFEDQCHGRYEKLIMKIEAALCRISQGAYGNGDEDLIH